MSINLKVPDIRELKPRLTVFGVGGAGGNAVNNMISAGLQGVDFVVANTDAQALTMSKAERIIQMGVQVTEGLGAGSQPDVGRAAAEEVIDEIRDHLSGAHMVFVTAGMGGGTGTGAAPVIARVAKELGILTVGVVTKPFHFEGGRRMKYAESGIAELQKCVDTQIIIPNQNLFRVANEKTTFADAFAMADQVLYSGVACITDLMVKEGLINLDFADVRSIMREMGKAMMGTGEASGEKRALRSAEAAIANPLIDDVSMKGARGLLISITGGKDLTLYEVDEAATRIREEVDQEANIIVGATFDESLEGIIRVSVVATGIDYVASTGRAAVAKTDRGARPQAARRHPAHCSRATTSAAGSSGAAATAPLVRASGDRGGGRGSRIAGRCDDPADHAEAVAVRGAGDGRACAAGHADSLHSAATRALRALRGCRGSTNCRCRPRTRSAPSAARSRKPVRRSSACRCCSAWPRSGSAAAMTARHRSSGPRPNGSNCRRCPSANPSGCQIRSRNTPSGRPRRPRRVWISTAGRPCLCISLWMTISSKFRRSCAARPTERRDLKRSAIPAPMPGSLARRC